MMKTMARALFLVVMLGCGEEDDSCTPGSGGAEATCSSDDACQSCYCIREGTASGHCSAPPS